jgi:hypothetical protein
VTAGRGLECTALLELAAHALPDDAPGAWIGSAVREQVERCSCSPGPVAIEVSA